MSLEGLAVGDVFDVCIFSFVLEYYCRYFGDRQLPVVAGSLWCFSNDTQMALSSLRFYCTTNRLTRIVW